MQKYNVSIELVLFLSIKTLWISTFHIERVFDYIVFKREILFKII